MATTFDRAVITRAGQALMQRAQLGETGITITGFGLGSGNWGSGEDLTRATALRSLKNNYEVSSSSTTDGGDMELKVLLVNAISGTSIVSTSYEMSELGIYAKDDEDNVILYGIAVPTGEPDEMPTYTGNNLVQIEQTFTIHWGDAEVTVDYGGAYALAEDLEALEDVVDGKADEATTLAGYGITDAYTKSEVDQAVSGSVGEHTGASVNSQTGVHGIRYYDDKLEVKDGNDWKEAAGSGGSTVTVKTEEILLVGMTCTLSIGGATYTERLTATGVGYASECVFKGVKETGAGTVSAYNGSANVTATVDVPYYGSYSAELIDGIPLTFSISTAETTLYGKTATISYDGVTKSVTIGSDGTASTRVKYSSDATATVTATDGSQTATTNVAVVSGTTEYDVTLSFVQIYGVEWDGTSTTAWSRTDDAAEFVDPVPAVNNGNGSSPFDDKMPWSGMKRVTDSAAGTLVEIPKFYYKWTRSGSRMKLQIADGAKDGFLVSPAHADRGDGNGERDVVYVGAYHCASSTYKSTTGVSPQVNMTRATARSGIHNLGSTIWQWDYAMLWTIQMLYLVEFADWNSQAKIGYGCGNNSSAETSGKCDGMTYHTGTNAANRTTYGHVRYRWIEDLWANVYDWCDGIYFSGANIYCIKNPSNFSDSSGGTLVGTRTTSSNYISKYTTPSATGFEYALYPSEVSGSDSTYVCDYCYYNASGVVLRVGGNYYQHQYRGLFCLNGNNAASVSGGNVGSRLQKLP